MVTLNAQSKSYGNTGQYIARLKGRDRKFGYDREFVGRKSGSTSSATIDEPGLYEMCNLDRKGRKEHVYRIIVEHEGELIELRAGGDNIDGVAAEETAMAITKRLDAGEAFDTLIDVIDGDEPKYRLRTKAEAKRADAATTIATATEACWLALGALGEREAKAVLKELKARVSPPKPPKEAAPARSIETPDAATSAAIEEPAAEVTEAS
jgi:hypothetical protein